MADVQLTLESIQRLLKSNDLHRAKSECAAFVTQSPECIDAWLTAAEVSRQLGEAEESIGSYRRALLLRPNDPEQLNGIGIALAQFGQIADAVGAFQAALKISPDYAQVHHNLGVAFVQTNRLLEAEASFRLAVRLKPDYAEGFLSLANMLYSKGDTAGAIASYEESIRHRPTSAEALSGLGLALIKAKRAEEGVVALRQATRLKRDFDGAFNNLGLALCEAGRHHDAEQAFEAALSLNPRSVDAHSNLGNLYKEQSRLDEALACYDLALVISADSVSARWNRSLTLLQMGDFENGWTEYESRWLRNSSPRRQLSGAEWDGSNLNGRRILTYCEQGLGDALQFVRYTALLKECGASVITEAPSPLVGILSSCTSIDRLICEGELLPPFDYHVPLMSLPRLFRTRIDSIPAQVPYLHPDKRRIEHFRNRLSRCKGFKIGVAWQGNPHHQWDAHRSLPLASFSCIARIAGVSLFSLQRGPGTEQLRSVQFPVEQLLDPDASDSESVLDTAAIMKSMDVVVTVDTATAHLGGAIGTKTWVLLSTLLDWRWLVKREDSPWYPTMRLFRQSSRDEWDPPLGRLAAELRCLLT